jgi:hypothetical protein
MQHEEVPDEHRPSEVTRRLRAVPVECPPRRPSPLHPEPSLAERGAPGVVEAARGRSQIADQAENSAAPVAGCGAGGEPAGGVSRRGDYVQPTNRAEPGQADRAGYVAARAPNRALD